MGQLRFGKAEAITCIQHVDFKSPKDEPLCLAYKTTTTFVAGGVWLEDDGYVLGVENSDGKVTSFYRLDPEKREKLQAEKRLPKPLPKYRIELSEYLLGYSLWITVVVLAVWSLVAAGLKKRRLAARAGEQASTPVSHGPPQLVTPADRYMTEQVTPLLEAGERVQHQAYTFDRVPEGMAGVAGLKARFAVLTNRRLFLIDTRPGAFGILLENHAVEALERTRILQVTVDDRLILLTLDDGTTRTLWVHKSKKASNQHRFLLDVPRLLGPAAATG